MGNNPCVLPYEGMCHRVGMARRWVGPHMQWFALRCLSGSEFTAMEALCRRGVFAFAPVEYRRRLMGRRRRPVQMRAALLPGYVLAKMQHGHAARECPLIWGVVTIRGEPAPLPEYGVLRLMQLSGRMDRQAA